MGGTAATVPSDNALAPLSNPGQLGLFSLNSLFNAETYAPKTQWLPQFHLDGLTYSSEAVNAGINLGSLLELPFSMSAGIGYSKVDLELGEFSVTDETGPVPIGQYQASEKSDNVSAAIGFEYYARVGLGWNFKKIRSELSSSAAANATDFGVLVDVPVMKIASSLADEDFEIAPRVSPLLNLSFSNVRSNVGGEIAYLGAAQGDPLPRTAILGGSIEGGLLLRMGTSDRKLITFTLIRQADDLLVTRYSSGAFSYQSGLGDIAFVHDVILGKTGASVNIRKGWQIQVVEALYVRGGSVDGPGLAYSTAGFSICLRGLARLVALAGSHPPEPWLQYFVDHFDIQYHYSSYSSLESPIDATTTGSVNLVMDGFLF